MPVNFDTNIQNEGDCLECIRLENSLRITNEKYMQALEALKKAKYGLEHGLAAMTYRGPHWEAIKKFNEAIETINNLI